MSDGTVSANTDDLSIFVTHGETLRGELEAVQQEVAVARQNAIAALGGRSGSTAKLRLDGLIGKVVENTFFVSKIHDSLLAFGVEKAGLVSAPTAEIDEAMRTESLDDEQFQLRGKHAEAERLARDDVLLAMEVGLTPEESGLPPQYFPADYRRYHQSKEEIKILEAKRDDVDGSSWSPFDGNTQLAKSYDAEISRQEAKKDRYGSVLGVSGNGRLTAIEAIASLGDWTDDRTWEGAKYGDWVNAYYKSNLSNPLDDGSIYLSTPSTDNLGDEFAFIGEQVAIEPEAATGFYNELGADGSAYLPTALVDNVERSDDDKLLRQTLADYGTALGHASRQRTVEGSKILSFSGAELMKEPLPTRLTNRHNHDDVYHSALLFVDGEFDRTFLAGAAVESVIQGASDSQASGSVQSEELVGHKTLSMGRGEDPRNILLTRSSEDVETAAAVVTGLVQEFSIDLLLSPEEPYRSVFTGSNIYDPGLSSQVADDSVVPITKFLATASADDESSYRILNRAARDPDLAFSDAGVAAGVDAVLAQHATLMYPEDALEAVGIEPTTMKGHYPLGRTRGYTEASGPMTADKWKAVHAKTLAYGQGWQLAAKTDELTGEALAGSIDAGPLDSQHVRPFATFAGAIRSEAIEGSFSYNAELDEEAKEYNRRVNTAVSAMISATTLTAGPFASIGSGAAGAAFTYSDPFSIPEDNELTALRDQFTELQFVQQSSGEKWANQIHPLVLDKAVAQGEIEVVVPGSDEPKIVPIRASKGGHQWLDEQSNDWNEVPPLFSDEGDALFDQTTVEKSLIELLRTQHGYMDGVLYAADDKDNVTKRRATAGVDGGTADRKLDNATTRVTGAVNRSEELGVHRWIADG